MDEGRGGEVGPPAKMTAGRRGIEGELGSCRVIHEAREAIPLVSLFCSGDGVGFSVEVVTGEPPSIFGDDDFSFGFPTSA